MIRSCNACGKQYEAKRETSKFCSVACRNRNARGANIVPLVTTEVEEDGPATAAVRRELATAGRLDGFLGAAAIQLAKRIDGSTGVIGYPGLVKELRATMEAAVAGVIAADPLDELRARRVSRLTG